MNRRRAGRRPARGPLALSLRSGAVGAAGTGAAAALWSVLVHGWRGLFSSFAALVVVTLFFALSFVLVEAANRVDPSLTLVAGLTGYTVLVVALGVLAFGTSAVDHVSRGSFALTVVVVALGWVVAQCVAVWTARVPYVQVELPARPPEDTCEGADTVRPS